MPKMLGNQFWSPKANYEPKCSEFRPKLDHTGCPNKFGICFEAQKSLPAKRASFIKKCTSLQKIAFFAFFVNC